MKKVSIYLVACFATLVSVRGQQFPIISQFMNNKLFFNPAYAGTSDAASASVLFRQQWGGVTKAPTTAYFSYDSPFKENMGLGVLVSTDRTGVTNMTDLIGNFSYRVAINSADESYLSFGMRLGITSYRSGLSNIGLWEPDDEVFSSNVTGAFLPRLGAGIHYYSPTYFASLSAPDMLTIDTKDVFLDDITNKRTLYRNYFFMGGYNFEVKDFILTPSLMVKYFPYSPLLVQLNANLKFSDRVSAGLGYRTKNYICLMGQISPTDNLKIGYAFDITPSQFELSKWGSHELMITYGLGGQ